MDEPSTPTPNLWQLFVDPPDDARPRAWWHWMDGNVDPAGIARDLTWLHRVGVRGVQLFDGGMGVPLVVDQPIRPGTPEWDAAVGTAVDTAGLLGLEFAVATSSGWSAAGGPWVRPEDAMKKVVWSDTVLDGGGPVDVVLPPLPAEAGPFQDCPRWGADAGSPWSVDWRVIGFPADARHEVLRPARVTASGLLTDPALLTDGTFGPTLSLPRDPDGWSEAWIEQEFDEPVTVRSVVAGLPGPGGFGAAPAPEAVLFAGDDSGLKEVARLTPTVVPARTASFAQIAARRFRLVLSGASAADALPPSADGVRLPPVLRRADAFHVSQFALRTGGLVHHAETKAGFGPVADFYAIDTDPASASGVVHHGDVVDLTPHVRDGKLTWDAPPGRWRILRLGASLTGQTNGPAPSDATGFEVDKLDGRRVAAYLDRHLARFGGGARFDALLSDSIEAGQQNWTDAIAEAFAARRGYDPTPWLPALTGLLVGGAVATDRFLYDWRRTIAELYADEYYGTLAAEAHRRGMSYYAEALEDGRPQLGDDLAMRAHADVPMGAMWTFDPETGPRPTYVADLKGASSVAHVHGRAHTGAEAFTSFDRPWASTPGSLKHVADLQLALGVTRFCIHTSPHQPLAAPPPGIALAPFLGQAFTVNETWAGMAGPWIDYLARCSALLSLGEPAVDIAVFVGEEAPVTGLFDAACDDSVPPGFDFDYIGAEGLAILTTEDGDIRSKGARYRLLYLGGSSSRMTVPSLREIERLLDAGATVIGLRPKSSPSLADDDAEFSAICDRIWGAPRTTGRVAATADLTAALADLALRPDLEVSGATVRTIARIVDGQRLTFLANPSSDAIVVTLTTAADVGPVVAWDPVAVRASLLRSADEAGRSFSLELAPFGSVFALPAALAGDVPAEAARPTGDASTIGRIPLASPWTLELPGRAPIDMPSGPGLWTELDEGARGFSGAATYRTSFFAAPGDRVQLGLGDVRGIARVIVNGVDCGVAWTAPFEVDVTDAVREGRNILAVEVATPWRNRLVAEAGTPSGEIFAPMTQVFEPDAEPLPAGLRGPVALTVENHP